MSEAAPDKKKSPLVNTIVFVVFILVVVGFLSSISHERSARIPENENHRIIKDAESCLACHSPEGIKPRSPKHPPKDQCMICHKTKRNRKVE